MTKRVLTRQQILDLEGTFISNFGSKYYVETEFGYPNFIYSDPDSGGDNTLVQTSLTDEEWLAVEDIPYGRDKGSYVIDHFVDADITILVSPPEGDAGGEIKAANLKVSTNCSGELFVEHETSKAQARFGTRGDDIILTTFSSASRIEPVIINGSIGYRIYNPTDLE